MLIVVLVCRRNSSDFLAATPFPPSCLGKVLHFPVTFLIKQIVNVSYFSTKIEKASWVPWSRGEYLGIWNTDFWAGPHLLARIRSWPLCQSLSAFIFRNIALRENPGKIAFNTEALEKDNMYIFCIYFLLLSSLKNPLLSPCFQSFLNIFFSLINGICHLQE